MRSLPEHHESGLAWIAGRSLRVGGFVVVFDAECHFDESGTHKGSRAVGLAGYIFLKENIESFERDWNAVLNWAALEYPLPFFHMADCAPDPGNGIFSGISKPHRIQIVARLIAAIKRHALQGIAVTLDLNEYNAIFGRGHVLYPDPYVLLTHATLQGITQWIEVNKGTVGEVAYFFEAGHASKPYADALMRLLFNNKKFGHQYRCAGHAFVPKRGNPGVQAADLLAWQWLKDRKNHQEGRPRRKDLASLLQHYHSVTHIEPDMLRTLAEFSGNFTELAAKLFEERSS